MQKHSSITVGRIKAWLALQVQPLVVRESAPITIEICEKAHSDAKSAESGPWRPIDPGYEWGPSFRMLWFRLRGQVPQAWAGNVVGLRAEVGGERTLWGQDCPIRGIDREHRLCRLLENCDGGEAVNVLIQAYAGYDARVWGDVPPRKELVEKVQPCELVQIHDDIQALIYDVEFALDLLSTLTENDPGYAMILRGVNDACNLWADGGPQALERCRKAIRDAQSKLDQRLPHTITPVGHAHLDTAWLWPLRITHLKMAHTASTQLDLMERYPEHVFCHSQASQYEWVEQEYPPLFAKIKEAVQNGQWAPLGSMWVEADCNLTGSESLIRQFLYGRRYFQKHFVHPTDDMFLPDVFGYSAALPQILEKFGIQYFLTQKISWNQFNKFPHNTFWWKGIDGTRIWSHFPPADTYVASCKPEEVIRGVRNHKDHARSDHSLYLYGFGDGGGGPTEAHLERLRRARRAPYMPEIDKRKSVRDFYAEAKAKSKDLMTWTGELYLELHRGTYTSQARNKLGNRRSEFLLRDAELLSSFLADYPAYELEQLWKRVLLNQFHDIIPGSSITEVYEDSAADYEWIETESKQIVEKAIRELGGRLDSSRMTRPVAIFQNATIGSQAEIPWASDDVPNSLVVGEERLPVQLVEGWGDRHLIFETPTTALGAVAVGDLSDQNPNVKRRVKANPRRLENGEWVVRFDMHGNITSIQSLDDHPVEFIEPGKLGNLFQIFDDNPQFWEAWDVDPYLFETGKDLVRSERFEVVERGPVRAAVEIEKRFGDSRIVQRISVGPTPGIRFDTWVDWRETRKMLKVGFPIHINSPRATYEIQFGHVERPTVRNTTWDVAKFEVAAQKWGDLSQGDYGAALLNDCKYGYDSVGNVLRLSLLRSPKSPDPICDMGEHRFTYVLLPHFDQIRHSDVVAAGYALNAPPRVVRLDPHAGAATETPRLVWANTRDLVIETVKKHEDSDRTIIRMYECHNTRGTVEIGCARPIRKAWLVDLNETILEELEPSDGTLFIECRPFEIITILVEF